MRNDWSSKVIPAIYALAAVAIFCPLTRADDSGAPLYKQKCAVCHGADGKGDTAVSKANKLRDLASADVRKQTDDELASIIGNGKGKMPAYGKSLKPEQIKELVAYIRSLKK